MNSKLKLNERVPLKMQARSSLLEKHKMNALESLDFRVPDDLPLRNFYLDPTSKRRDAYKLIAKWIIYLLIGMFTGLVAFGLKRLIEYLHELKLMAMEHFIEDHTAGSHTVAFFIWWGINLGYALISCFVVLLCGPLSGGSGIPEVKGYLNGVRVPGTINLKTFLGKLFSIMFSFSSCLSLGPEGPMVHIGSMIGGGLSAAKSKTLHIRLPKMFERIRTDREQRDFISSGAAAGIAAAFGAPIGGALFALEETASFWSRELTWRSFFGCMVAAFTVNAMNQIGKNARVFGDYGLLSFGVSRFYLYSYEELAFFIVLGVIGGLLGAAFVRLNIALNRWRREHIAQYKWKKVLEVVIVVTLSAVLTFGLSAAGQCRSIDSIINGTNHNVCDNTNDTMLAVSSVFCNEGEFNDFATLFFQPQDKALRMLLSRASDVFSFPSLFAFLPVYYALVVLCAGLSVAGGLFVPMMLIGATYGRIVGKIAKMILIHFGGYEVDASIYALVGAAAMMSGFSRTTISLVVIIVELTETTQFLLPIMIAVLSAKWIGDALGHALYEKMLELKSITFLEHHPPRQTFSQTVADIMPSSVICLNEMESLDRIVNVLKSTTHNGFPVVKNLGEDRPATYRGFILRKQLLILLERKKFQVKFPASPTPELLDYEDYISLLNKKWTLEEIPLPPEAEWRNLIIDLGPYMDRSHPLVQNISSFLDAYKLFQTLGLRHLPVVDDNFQVVGILTRHDLLSFHETDTIESLELDL